MAGISTDGYETRIHVTKFGGIAQEGDGYDIGIDYAVAGKNFDTHDGGLKAMLSYTAEDATLPAPIGTLAALYRRYPPAGATDPLLFVAVAGGRLYVREGTAGTWVQKFGALYRDDFDFVTYEVNVDYDGNASATPIDVLLLTNSQDGMLCVYGNDQRVKAVSIMPDGEDLRFDKVARHSERIWVTGIPNDPDKLMYSAPYDPFDWAQNDETPEDGAGDILQPSWDGDSFVALRPFGSQLLAFKKTKIWRILGTNPGDYILREQYGGGSIVENTIVVHNDRVFMLGYGGILSYDGTTVSRFYPTRIQTIVARINADAIQKACGAMLGETYLLAVPLDDSTINNAIIEYSIRDRSFNLREGVNVKAFLPYMDKLYFTSDETPGKVFEATGGMALPMEYQTAWQDIGKQSGEKNVVKSGFSVYLMADTTMPVTVEIQTEKKTKSKTVTLTANKAKKIRISNSGRQWRLKLSISSTSDWTMLGGMIVSYEIDYD